MLVFKGKAEVLEALDRPLRSATAPFPWPHVIRLVNYVRVPRTLKRKISRRALFARDGWRCVYCGTACGRLTLDHVVPRSRGGDSVWENVVTSCAPCNLRKGDRLSEEIGLTLRVPPTRAVPVALHPTSPRRRSRTAGALPRPGLSDEAADRDGLGPDASAPALAVGPPDRRCRRSRRQACRPGSTGAVMRRCAG